MVYPQTGGFLKIIITGINKMTLRHIRVAVLLGIAFVSSSAQGVEADHSPDRYNVVWESPSKDQNGSMPLGNGSTGLNAWIEPGGDPSSPNGSDAASLVFYISRTDSWDDNGRLLKVGRVRVTLDPPLSTDDFVQTLSLGDGTLKARCGETEVRLWVDANYPVIHAEFSGPEETDATAAVELWRTEPYRVPSGWECSDVNLFNPEGGWTYVEPDTLLVNQEGRVGWYHRNIKSVGPAMHAKIQGVADFEREDPLLHRTFGALIKAEGAERIDDTHLLSPASKSHRFDIYVHTEHPATEKQWLAAVEKSISAAEAVSFEKRRAAHEAWWKSFWQRSWIHATQSSVETTRKSAIPSNALNFRFGTDPNGGNRFSGELGRATILNRALGEAEIRDLAGSRSEHAGLKEEVLFSAKPDLYSEVNDSAAWTDSLELTAEMWINPNVNAGSARILDKTMPGSNEGFLLDTHPGDSLRVIVGDKSFSVQDCLEAGQWNHVAVAVDSAKGRIELYLNGERIAGEGSEKVESDAMAVSRAYALQRYINACAGRGAYPIKFNGSIFTVDGFEKGQERGPDYRRWGPGYWWQNTRLPYISMCTSGDFEMTKPLYKMYCQDLFTSGPPTRKGKTSSRRIATTSGSGFPAWR
jgi:hypothetical protein